MAVNKVVYGGQTLIDLTDTTATAGDVASGKYFYTNAGVLTAGTSSGGGSGNGYVTGTFTVGSTGGVAETVTIPYTGSGYPVTLAIYPADGVYNSASTFYNTILRYSVGLFFANKNYPAQAPTYAASGTENQFYTTTTYKSSASSATTLTRTGANATYVCNNANAAGGSTSCVRFNGSGTNLTYYVCNGTSSTYGLMPGITYRYEIVYSEAYTYEDITDKISFTYRGLIVSDLTAIKDKTTNVATFFATVTATETAPVYELDTYYHDLTGTSPALNVHMELHDQDTDSWEPFDIIHDDGTGTGMHYDAANATSFLNEGETARLIVTWIADS